MNDSVVSERDTRRIKARVSRRNFLKAAGAGAALTAGTTTGAIPFVVSKASAQGSWDQEADIVVVGSGGAALSAAVFAHSLGNSVIVLEKADFIGGTTAKSGGVYWIPNNSRMAEAGLEDPKEDAIRYMVRTSWAHLYAANDEFFGLPEAEYRLIEAFYDSASVAVDLLAELGALQSAFSMSWDGAPQWDYYAQLPENKANRGRALVPQLPDGQAVQSGAELIRQLNEYLVANGIEVQTGQRVVAVVQDDEGAVLGVEAAAYTGDDFGAATPVTSEERTGIKANKGVIFGSGGFTHNPWMRTAYLRGPVFGGCAVPTNEGDFVAIGIDAGADLGNMANAFWAEVPLEQALAYSSTPSDLFVVPGDSAILVNKHGRRVVDEKIQYNERTQVHFVWDPVAADFANQVLILIYDQRTADLAGGQYPIPAVSAEAADVVTGETWEELAEGLAARFEQLSDAIGSARISADFSANLAATIERFNGFAVAGVDEDFHRGEAPISISFNGPAREGNDYPNSTMYPISDTGPYYALLVGGGTLDTKGGPRVNTNGEVLRPDGSVIPGLYGTGNCISSPAGQAYWGAGGTIGVGLTYSYLAAHAANARTAE